MIHVNIDGKEVKLEKPTKVIDLLPENDNKKTIICKIDHKIRELSYIIDKDCKLEFYGLEYDESVRIYEASLRFLFAMAVKRLYPDFKVNFSYYMSKSIYATLLNRQKFTSIMVKRIITEMEKIIEKNQPFVREKMTKEEARNFFEKEKYYDKLNVLKYRPENHVNIYDCLGYKNYCYSYMVYSSGYLNKFKLLKYKGGVVIQFPRSEQNGDIPTFKKEKVYSKSLDKARRWSNKVKTGTVSEVNQHLEDEKDSDFIGLCEAKHNQMMQEVANKIGKKKKVKLIAIAGPSSSGKTTFSKRLKIQLMAKGIKPVMLSIDDYYIDRDKVKPEKNGKLDLEHIKTIDVKLFNKHLDLLIKGEEVEVPKFDFNIQRRVKGKKMKVRKGAPIIIEGIHALNDKLTQAIPNKRKFKIYISPHIQMNLDDLNPISITYYRLVRRIVRDNLFRNSSAENTLSMWESVRKGEFRWIYDNQENADYVYNSHLSYELCVLKKYALPLLENVSKDDENYILANKVIKFLKYFKVIEPKYVPCDSLLTEFIGNSCIE